MAPPTSPVTRNANATAKTTLCMTLILMLSGTFTMWSRSRYHSALAPHETFRAFPGFPTISCNRTMKGRRCFFCQ